MRTLGLDVGDKRIGVAISDPDEILASPLITVPREDDDRAIDAIVKLVDRYEVKRIVVGLPYSMDGGVSKQAASVMDFVGKLCRCTRTKIELRDERLSTVAAERLLTQAGARRVAVKSRRDAAAAAFVLQGYLDSLKVQE
ncbi:MAG TPA: Holliday junction resolvase RuvX [Dehalococcoidia bacterium]|nr:Holliday junction resolvase RuvX [Dehalococcoidia bacterium]